VLVSLSLLLASTVAAHDHPDDGLEPYDPSEPLIELDLTQDNVISEGPSAKVIKNLEIASHGARLRANATTDVWALDGYAYIGTFNDPCGGSEPDGLTGPGVQVFNVKNPNKARYVATVPSQTGSRINDVKVANMNSGAILVHSNETCGAGGMGGFEVYNVDDPANPIHLASVRVHEANATLRTVFGGVNRGVHNLFLFTQGERDYVAMQTHAWFGGLQIFELTDPSDPQLVVEWGAELLCEEAFCSEDPYNETDTATLIAHINGYMFCTMAPCFGNSQNRFLHDVTVTDDGTLAYLSHWDAGLILLDISDPADPVYISTALDPANGSLDGEVNSHAAWPTADGSVVVETEEDFAAWVSVIPPGSLTFGEGDPTAPLPGVAISTSAGDDFEASQPGNDGTVDETSLAVDDGPLAGNSYAAVELAGDQPKFGDIGPVSGPIVWIGRACDGDPILNEAAIADGGIAVVRRGACTFREKNFNAAAAGADAIVIANNVATDTPWGGVRIWDYSDPANPVLASTFDTFCSSSPTFDPTKCDLRGTYSVHNVIVEGNMAYFSWYSDGVLIVDISDPYNPVEVARYHEAGPEFEARNGGIQDVWGIYKEPGKPWIYASDRNGGLYVLKEYGAGSKNKP
jgi:hypothetical protein